MTAATTMRLGRLLVTAGVISDDQLAEAVAVSNDRPLPHVLAELGFASETGVAQAIAESMGLAFIDITAYDMDANAALMLTSDLMRKYTVLPIKVQDEELVVAMADPANIFAIDDLRIVTGREIRPVVAVESDLSQAIDRFSAGQTNLSDMVGDLEQSIGTKDDKDAETEGEGDGDPFGRGRGHRCARDK